MKYLLLTLAFLLEVTAFIGFAYSPVFLSVNNSLKIILGVMLLLVLIIFWSLFMAPKAPKKFKLFPYYVSKALIYSISALVIVRQISNFLGISFVLVALFDEILLFKHNTS